MLFAVHLECYGGLEGGRGANQHNLVEAGGGRGMSVQHSVVKGRAGEN